MKGTSEVLRWREVNCPDARLIYFSTLCAAGTTTGPIHEAPLEKPEVFVNGYEASKWRAEQIVQGAHGPVAILRLATVVGSQRRRQPAADRRFSQRPSLGLPRIASANPG